jgi:hypothetical protein
LPVLDLGMCMQLNTGASSVAQSKVPRKLCKDIRRHVSTCVTDERAQTGFLLELQEMENQVTGAKYEAWFQRHGTDLDNEFNGLLARSPGPVLPDNVARDRQAAHIWDAWQKHVHTVRPNSPIVFALRVLATKVARKWPNPAMRAGGVSPYRPSTFKHKMEASRRAASELSGNVERVKSPAELAKRRRAVNMPRQPGSSKFMRAGAAAAPRNLNMEHVQAMASPDPLAAARRAMDVARQANAAAMAEMARVEGARRRSPRRWGAAAGAAAAATSAVMAAAAPEAAQRQVQHDAAAEDSAVVVDLVSP